LSAKPRIAVVTSLFPVAGAPYAGRPIYETVVRLQQWAEIRVLCPMPVYPRWLQPAHHPYHPVDPSYAPPRVATQYVEYGTLPLVGRPLNGWLSMRRLWPALREFQPELILAYWIYPTAYAATRVGRKLGVPVIAGARGSDLRRIPDPVIRWLTRQVLQEAALVLTVSEDLRRRAVELGSDPERVHVVVNGCDTTLYRPLDRRQARAELKIEPDAEVVLYVGHLIPSKGVLDLWRAFEALVRSRPGLWLALVGEGPSGRELRSRAEHAGLAGRVLLRDSRPAREVPLWMAACDVFCLPSHSEGCPNVVLEAISCGRPVVATAVGGTPELVNEQCGLLVPARNPQRLAQALEQALSRPWAPDRISAQFKRAWEEAAQETFQLCRSLLGSCQGRAFPGRDDAG